MAIAARWDRALRGVLLGDNVSCADRFPATERLISSANSRQHRATEADLFLVVVLLGLDLLLLLDRRLLRFICCPWRQGHGLLLVCQARPDLRHSDEGIARLIARNGLRHSQGFSRKASIFFGPLSRHCPLPHGAQSYGTKRGEKSFRQIRTIPKSD